MDSVISNGFQFVINSAQPKQILQSASDFQAVNLQAILNGDLLTSFHGFNSERLDAIPLEKRKIPTIILTAHYDTFGMATVRKHENFWVSYNIIQKFF